MKQLPYILVMSAIIPATWIIFSASVLVFYLLENSEFTRQWVWLMTLYGLGLAGYVGLLMLMKGLQKTKHLFKLVLLACGLLSTGILMFKLGRRKAFSWILDFEFQNLLSKWVLLVMIAFVFLLFIDLVRIKKLQDSETSSE